MDPYVNNKVLIQGTGQVPYSSRQPLRSSRLSKLVIDYAGIEVWFSLRSSNEVQRELLRRSSDA
jgi:hypothetical protein